MANEVVHIRVVRTLSGGQEVESAFTVSNAELLDRHAILELIEETRIAARTLAQANGERA